MKLSSREIITGIVIIVIYLAFAPLAFFGSLAVLMQGNKIAWRIRLLLVALDMLTAAVFILLHK